jgi:hypothetical protein
MISEAIYSGEKAEDHKRKNITPNSDHVEQTLQTFLLLSFQIA